MPTIEWNEASWTGDFKKFKKSKSMPFYGDFWGKSGDGSARYLVNKYLIRRNIPGNLSKVNKKYIRPYVGINKAVLEIGSGGGRWTQFLLTAKELVVVELNPIFFPYLKERFPGSVEKMKFYNTSGYELDGIDSDSIDFVFTFGTFVHIEPDGISAYLGEIRRVLKKGGVAVVQYSDKTKKSAQKLMGFSDMNSTKMEKIVRIVKSW